MDWSAVASAFNGLSNLGFNIYDRWYQAKNNQRDFDYQAALQRDVFNREDTAVQRRMADLQAAGLNPNLAAGSAASSGAVVGRSSTPGLPTYNSGIGAALDTATAVQQLRNLREQNQILQNQKRETAFNADMADYQSQVASIQSYYDQAELLNMLGINAGLYLKRYDSGDYGFEFHSDMKPGTTKFLDDSPLNQILKLQLQNNQNSAALLQKDNDFYTADKIAGYIGAGVNAFSGIGSGYKSFGFGNKRR